MMRGESVWGQTTDAYLGVVFGRWDVDAGCLKPTYQPDKVEPSMLENREVQPFVWGTGMTGTFCADLKMPQEHFHNRTTIAMVQTVLTENYHELQVQSARYDCLLVERVHVKELETEVDAWCRRESQLRAAGDDVGSTLKRLIARMDIMRARGKVEWSQPPDWTSNMGALTLPVLEAMEAELRRPEESHLFRRQEL